MKTKYLKIEYTVGDCNLTNSDDRYSLDNPTWDDDSPRWLAEECARNYFIFHNGFNNSWPIQIAIFINDKFIGIFDIELESEPVFSATRRNDDH
ncbi:hypothetical protein [Xenorhabdus bovienii]|uniref:hypothetical protein n=1 Tax=Xenorhabdus bovienii TaxID=40576 RepID=UPI003DA361C4